MPRYHFNVRDGSFIPDDDGTELADISAARRCAVETAGQLLRDNADQFWAGEEWHMEVTDDRGLILFCLTFIATRSAAMPR